MKKAAVKIIVVVAMAAAMLCNAIVPVAAASNANFTIQFGKTQAGPGGIATGTGTGMTYTTGDTAYLILNGNIEKNKTYSISILTTSNDLENADNLNQNPFYGINAIMTDSPFDYTSQPPNNTIQIPNYNFSSSSISSTTQHYVLFYITFNTNELAFVEGNKYIYFGFKSNSASMSVTLLSNTIHALKDDTMEVFESINNSITNINSSIQEVITNQENNSTNIEQIVTNTNTIKTITQTISNQISTVISNIQDTNTKLDNVNNNLTQIINIGQDNNIPNNIDELDTAQQQLHNSEEALTNKSESLASRATAGINTAKASSTQFISTITPAVSTVTGTVTQAIESLPQEIQPMVYSMPLFSFAVWLIGLKK